MMTNILFSPEFITELLVATIRMAIPLLLVAFGEMYSEKAGLVNIGLDGIMTVGALFGFLGTFYSGNPLIGAFFGIIAGIIFNMIFAVMTVSLRSNQIVTGMALNILGPAVATFIYRQAFGIQSSLEKVPLFQNIKIPLLGDLPFVGGLLFNHNILVYFSYLLVIFSVIYFNKTKSGLNYIAVGEFPHAAETLGINVMQKKYIACIICGALSGLAGAYLTTSYISSYSDGIVAGRGFIGLAAVIFGRWKPIGVLLATVLFGFADALQLRLQLINSDLPYQILAMLPYLMTLFALIFFGRKNAGPKSNGKPYYKEAK